MLVLLKIIICFDGFHEQENYKVSLFSFQTDGNVAGWDTEYFRGKYSTPCQYIKIALLNPSKRIGAPWIVEVLLKQW